VRRNGRHLELFTFHLEQKLNHLLDKGDLAPFDVIECRPVMTDTESPYLLMGVTGREDLHCKVTYRDKAFLVGAFPFLPGDLVKVFLAASLAWKLAPQFKLQFRRS
jgi:hypothetical protein